MHPGWTAPLCVAPQPNSAAIGPSSRLPARRLTALGARGALSTDCQQPVDGIPPAFERRCIQAGPLRSALLLSPIALLSAPRRALPARRLTALDARGALSTDCQQPVDGIPRHSSGDASRLDRSAPPFHNVKTTLYYVMCSTHLMTPRLRSALLLSPIALLSAPRRALPARRLAALGARGACPRTAEQWRDGS